MGRRKDPFWMYVKDLKNGSFQCNFCKRDFAGGISKIKSHLSGVKGRDIQICPQVPEAVKLTAQLAIDDIDTPTKRAKYVAASNTVLQGEHISGSSSSHMPNLCKGHDKSILHKQLATFLLSEGISFHAAQSPIFKDFLNGIAKHGPGYEVPSNIGLENCYELVREEVKTNAYFVLQNSVITGCTLMYNKSSKQKSFVDIFVCTPVGVACMEGFDLDGFNDVLSSIMSKIHPENVVQLIINDGDGDFKDEVSSICTNYPWIYRTPCAARWIELLLRKIYFVPSVYNTIQVARGIGTYIYKNKVNVSYLRKKVNGRFRRRQRREDAIASSFFMLTSLLEVKNELQDLREPLECRIPLEMVSRLTEKFIRRARFTGYVIRCKEFWSQAKIVAQVMRPIFQALCLVRFEGPTSGYLYEMMESIKDALEQCCDTYRDSYPFLYDIRNILDKVLSNIIHPIHAAAAFLNPMYMCSEKFKENEEMKNGINHIWEHLVEAKEKEAFMKQVELYRKKDSNVFTTEAMIKLKTSHPRIWWEYCGNHISVLQKYAIRILSQPCSSSLCKQYKSLHTNSPGHAFKMNAILKERPIIEPIILDKLEVSDEVNYQLLFDNELEDIPDDESDDDLDDLDEDYVYSFIESDIFEEDVYLVDWSHRYADNILKDPIGSWLDLWPRKLIESSK